MYVGRKYMTMSNGKGKPRVESKWRDYWGSCRELLDQIEQEGKEAFERKILKWCKTRGETNYEEVAEQMKRDVLHAVLPDGSRAYYNGHIMSRWFVTPEQQRKPASAEARAKISKSNTGKKRSAEAKLKYSAAKKGIPKSAEHRKKLSEQNLGKLSSRNKSGHCGIFPVKDGYWRATWRGKYIGQAKTIEEAVALREAARIAEENKAGAPDAI